MKRNHYLSLLATALLLTTGCSKKEKATDGPGGSNPPPDPPHPQATFPAIMGSKVNFRDAQAKYIRWNPNLPEKDQIDSTLLPASLSDRPHGFLGVHGGSHLSIAYNNLFGVRYINSRPVAAYWKGNEEIILSTATGLQVLEETVTDWHIYHKNDTSDVLINVLGLSTRGVFDMYYYRITKSGDISRHDMPDAYSVTNGGVTSYGGYNASNFSAKKVVGLKTEHYVDGIYTAFGTEAGIAVERYIRWEGHNNFKINATHLDESRTGYILGSCLNGATGATVWFAVYLPHDMKAEDVRFVPVALTHDPLQDDVYAARVINGKFCMAGNGRAGNTPYYYTISLPDRHSQRLTVDKKPLEVPANAQYIRSKVVTEVGNTMYVIGTHGSHGCFWKDGKFHALPGGGAYSTQTIFVYTPVNSSAQ